MKGSPDIVQIDIDPTKVGQNKVSNRVGSLNGMRIIVKGVQEPRVLCFDKLARFLIRPELHGGCQFT